MFGRHKSTATPSLDKSLRLSARTQQALARAERDTKAIEHEIAKANANLLATSMKADRLVASVTL